jgi:hypothetical protein
MSKKQGEKESNKITNEKPVSLSPLGFKEALAALLKVKPKLKKEIKKSIMQKENEKADKKTGG